jgi:RNAse (barnase) inhibitor barstar
MKAPDLAVVDDACVYPWTGSPEPLKAAAAHAHLKYAVVDFAHAKDRATLFSELDRALKLPEHFGHNWDALADVLEDRDWLGKSGRAIVFAGCAGYRRDHPNDWSTLEDIFAEACEFWKERHVAFWIFTA